MSKKFVQVLAIVVFVCFLVVVAVNVIQYVNASGSKVSNSINIDENVYYPVTKILDGDTIKVKVNSKTITVRMLGIDTPETVDPRKEVQCYGKEASDATKGLLSNNKVSLHLNPNREVSDKYGRYLAYVYLEDGTFVNEYLIENGYAKEYKYGKSYSERDNFRNVEIKARNSNLGLWAACNAVPSVSLY